MLEKCERDAEAKKEKIEAAQEKYRLKQESQAEEEYRHREIVACSICSSVCLLLKKFYSLDIESTSAKPKSEEEAAEDYE